MTGNAAMRYTTTISTPLGPMLAATEENKLVGLWFEGQEHFPVGREGWSSEPDNPFWGPLKEQLTAYFNGRLRDFTIKLAPQGTAFRQEVWSLLRTIPVGTTSTYGTLAQRLCRSRLSASARAIGGAIGRNPISIIIPCHRVIGANGALTGYAGGLERKRRLLQMERQYAMAEGTAELV